GSPRSSAASAKRRRSGLLGIVAALVLSLASPAFAQVSGSASIESDYRFRGHSLSAGHPVTTLDLGNDHGSGIYVNGSAIVVIEDDDGPALLGVVASAGYAAHVSPTLSLDAGVLHTEYTHYFSAGR